MRAFVLINVRTGEERQIKKLFADTPGITRAEVTFGPYDMIVQVEAPDLAALGLGELRKRDAQIRDHVGHALSAEIEEPARGGGAELLRPLQWQGAKRGHAAAERGVFGKLPRCVHATSRAGARITHGPARAPPD